MFIVSKEKGLKKWSQTKADCMVMEETPNGTNIKIDYDKTQIVITMSDSEAGLFLAQSLVSCPRAKAVVKRNVNV